MTTFVDSFERFEHWMRAQLRAELVEADLAEKARVMRKSAFAFLRATYWRWAETVPGLAPELIDAPAVLAVGDIHLENFGTWRDAEGRLVFGVNDFDESDEMAYTLDLLRLLVSAMLGADKTMVDGAGAAIIEGYAAALDSPRAIVLDKEWQWLREPLVVTDDRRLKFWDNIEKLERAPAPYRFRGALAIAMPEQGLAFVTAPRSAGVGSLGRPRWLGVAEWRGAPVVREAKALLTSGWSLAHGAPTAPIRSGEIAAGRFRSPGPWFQVAQNIVVRRLSPNNRKIDADKHADLLHDRRLHEVMGRELACLHLGTGDGALAAAIRTDLCKRPTDWLVAAATRVAAAVEAEFKQWKRLKGTPLPPSR